MGCCPGCGGVVGRDCFNPSECEWIARDMEARALAQRQIEQDEYAAAMREMERDHYRELEEEYEMELFEAGAGHA